MAEKGLETLPASTSAAPPFAPFPDSNSIASSETAIDFQKHTLTKRPWRLRTTSFSQIAKEHYEGEGTAESPYMVEWLDDDPENPQTYSNMYKWVVTCVVAFCTLCVALASSVYTGAAHSIIDTFHCSEEVFTLGVSLFVLGFAFGPLIWAPVSEVYGRRNTFIFTYFFFTVWNAASAGANSMTSLLVFRALAGIFGSSPLANAGGTIADMFDSRQRGLAMAIFAAMPFTGPALGPIIGGFIGDAGGFRWVQGFLGLFTAALTVVGFVLIPETYAATLLRRRAALLSKLTGNVYRAPPDMKAELDIKKLMKVSLARPWKFLFLEPIVLIISIFMSVVYGSLYMLFGAFPVVFQQGRGWSAGIGGLAFLGVLVGMLMGVGYTIFYVNPKYIRVAAAHGGRAPAEARLPPAIVGSFSLVIGLAWFAASCGPTTPWIVPIMAGAPFGTGMVLVFLSLMNYLVEVFTIYAASVLAANSVLRSLFGFAFPLFTSQMYSKLGVHWASAIPGFLALACLPFPILFYKYGHIFREKSKYAKEAEAMMQKMMAHLKEKKAAPVKEDV